jgi:hypothetical protein
MKSKLHVAEKQRCEFISILFEICIHPLIEILSSAEFLDRGFYWGPNKEDGVTVQVISDDILFFSNRFNGM